jgi:hypothetical protein
MVRPTHTVPSAALGCLKFVHMAISRDDETLIGGLFPREFTVGGVGDSPHSFSGLPP